MRPVVWDNGEANIDVGQVRSFQGLPRCSVRNLIRLLHHASSMPPNNEYLLTATTPQDPEGEHPESSMANLQWRPSPLRRISPPAIITIFLVVILWLGASNDYSLGSLSAGSFLGQPKTLEEELSVEASSMVSFHSASAPFIL